jgi:glutamate---cysteine ligase / carboxylate-amine ligase
MGAPLSSSARSTTTARVNVFAGSEASTVHRLRTAFDSSALSLTVGAEEELLLVDVDETRLVPAGPHVSEIMGDDGRFHTEFRQAQTEIVTRPCLSAEDAGRELALARLELGEGLIDQARLVACGAHPTARDAGPVTDGERYRAIAEGNPWAALHMLTCGLHVHVAVGDADRALAVHNALRSYLPELAALAANSPYHHAADAGTASVRMHLNRTLARHGVPPAFRDWDEYAGFVSWGDAGRSIPDPTHHWWDLRLNPRLGTIELRVFDAQTELADAAALVGLAQTLVAWLVGRFDAGDGLTVHNGYRIAESMWVAARSGAPCTLFDLDTGMPVSLEDRVGRLLEELAPLSVELGTERELARVALLARSCGASRQRDVARRTGVDELVDWLATRTIASARSYLVRAGVDISAGRTS